MALSLLQYFSGNAIRIATCAASTIGTCIKIGTCTKIGTCITIGSFITIGACTIAVPALGFTSVGIAAGSVAAWFQSAFLGSFIAPGSVFAALQSMGATGMTYAACTKLIAACAATCAAIFGI